MGNYFSREEERILEECKYYAFPYVKDLKLSVWGGYIMDKNFDYYMGKRCTKVSRSLYPSYQRGLIYGYYYYPHETEIDSDGYETDSDTDSNTDSELERAL